MKKGLVLGKFMPLHSGHIDLINFASNNCDELIVLVCAVDTEPIDGQTRLEWIQQSFVRTNIKARLLVYDERLLSSVSESSIEISRQWAEVLKEKFPSIDIIFTSELYGQYLASFLQSLNMPFDIERKRTKISATEIRKNPFKNWEFIPSIVRPYFIKKICLYGTESTGKTILTRKLASYFNTEFVEEQAREIIAKTEECTKEDLYRIAESHAVAINQKVKRANKLLLVDTDLNITRSYCQFLFHKELKIPEWIEEANRFDLWLYLDNDAPYVQDGTRLSLRERDLLNESHKKRLEATGISYVTIKGDWETRFKIAVETIKTLLSE